ncbi:carboxypeptidase regulatory-like domain-containing protein [Cellulomonas sp. PhB150]|uniref:carboxypeptidase regulatory-like domain-containing protein n=1 Tax=Cellulomonas sp. PhB150 TaxID=2485188 RepID=UPI00131578D1|nr:carboxypeptidase regulatory-like domain-containing protein [Cellulomonas sp. PhB150]
MTAALVVGLVGSAPAVAGAPRVAEDVGVVSGTVTFAGAPAADAYVQLFSPGKWASARTAADGTYSTTAEPGTYEVTVLGPLGSRYLTTYLGGTVRAADSTPLKVTAGATATADVRLVAGAGVTGKVVDATGAPLAGATVWLSNVDRFGTTPATTDAAGVYTTYELATGKVSLYGFKGTHKSVTKSVAVRQGTLVRAPPLRVQKVVGARIAGHVRATNASDQPVQLLNAKKVTVGWERPNAHGNVAFVGLKAGTYRVVLSGTNISKKVTVKATTRASFGTLVRGRPTAVSGVVTSPTGKPALEAEVRVVDSFGTIAGTATTNAKGRYRVVGVISGRYTVVAEPDTTSYARGSLSLSVTKGRNKVAPVLRLPTGGKVYGYVTSAKGKSVEGITVFTTDRSAVTDARGRWVLTGVAKGKRHLTVSDDVVGGYHTVQTSVVAKNGRTVRVATIVVR